MSKSEYTFDWPLVGNRQVTDFLERLIARGNAAGTYIFTGPDNLGKTTVARYFAQSLVCANKDKGGRLPCGDCPACRQFSAPPAASAQPEDADLSVRHADYHFIKKAKDKKNISVEQVRDFIKALSLSSFLGKAKIGIIKHADSLSEEAANALLKTLEEPRPDVVAILIAGDLAALPATIVSRSQVLSFHPVAAEEIYDHLLKDLKAQRSQAKNLSRLSLGRPALAVKFLEDREFLEEYSAALRCFLDFFRQDLNERFAAIAALLKDKGTGQELVMRSKRLLEVWQGAARDCLLLEFNLGYLLQHELAAPDLETVGKRVPAREAVRLARIMRRAAEYLDANVNPRTVLETVAISI